ncbi:tryptophan-rich sensory protein [Arthrobacter livingstonensis]|uniref:Tryptophan-rich sensory protein n=1 Tax=Arthrobacter livingstonensis TaxID=670078 RepID=A0A2V5LTM8_9MICC|nr:tryptophan-rich sensory protein [Arthrobacter livingstonensis]PYI65166.1 tryptophan-rich sensory protein [Arthrobacter livingstonensis]
MRTTYSASLTARILCALAVLLATLGAFYGSGALGGTPIADAAGGRLGADSTLLAPGTGAFSIWSFIYTALLVYAAWQLTAKAGESQSQRKMRPWAAASAVMNALWIGAVQLGWLGLSVLVIVLLLGLLVRIFLLMMPAAESAPERWITALAFGPYLGWVSVATVANIAAWLSSLGVGDGAAWATPLAVALVVVAALIAAGTVHFSGGRIAAALAMAWGIAWIGVGRSDGGLESVPVSSTALCAAALVIMYALMAATKRRMKFNRTLENAA